jgi:hypothetical protein
MRTSESTLRVGNHAKMSQAYTVGLLSGFHALPETRPADEEAKGMMVGVDTIAGRDRNFV